MTAMILRMLRPLLVTLILEMVAAILWGVRVKRNLLVVALVNCITNPGLNLLLLVGGIYFPYSVIRFLLLGMELLIVLSEGFLFRSFLENVKHPFLFSFCLNCVSFFLGGILLRFL